MNFLLDIIIFFYIIFAGFRGFYRGFLEQIGQILSLTISFLVSFTYADKFSTFYVKKIPFESNVVYFFSRKSVHYRRTCVLAIGCGIVSTAVSSSNMCIL